MGCCLTTATATATDANKTLPKPRDTSPPGSGEETVKQVLADITPNKLPPTTLNQPGLQFLKELRSKDNNPVNETASEVSSEIYTYSVASHSTITTTTIGTGVEVDDDADVTQKVNKPPPVKMVSRRPPVISSGERARRKERGGRTRRELTSRTVTAAPFRRNVVSDNVVGRVRKVKEKSPVVNSGKRVPVKVRENEVDVKVKKVNDVGVMPELEMEKEICDLLDNPRVSLECFIFL